jgi:hypothetical protein
MMGQGGLVRSVRAFTAAAAAVALIVLAAPAAAQSYADVKGMDERFRLDLGGFFQQFDTTLRLDSESLGTGTEINFEDDLGQDARKTSFRASGYWRFGRHGRFDFGFLTFSRSNSTTITRDIQFGDHVYHAGATIDSKFSSTQVEAYYAYSFVNTGEVELGAKLGISALFQSVKFEGSGNITGPGGTVSGSRASEDRSVVAPIPAIGAYGRFTLLPGLLISGHVRGLPTVTISGYSGSLIDAGAFLDWYPWRNFGFGAGYSYWKITFEREADPTIQIDYSYSGPLVYLTLAF